MKIKFVFLSTALAIALTLPVFGQHDHADMKKTDMNKHDMSMMGKPTVDATVEGLHMKVWLMTQKEHKKMMKDKMGGMMMRKDMKGMNHDGMGMKDTSMTGKDMMGMKHDGMGMDNATREAMMSGTHHIMLDVTDAASSKEVANASTKVMIVSPTKKNSSVDLKQMTSHFGNGLTLNEKGEYQFTVSVNVSGVSKTEQFTYAVK
jgi:hypothetical protein